MSKCNTLNLLQLLKGHSAPTSPESLIPASLTSPLSPRVHALHSSVSDNSYEIFLQTIITVICYI